jgi:hypothetical protein
VYEYNFDVPLVPHDVHGVAMAVNVVVQNPARMKWYERIRNGCYSATRFLAEPFLQHIVEPITNLFVKWSVSNNPGAAAIMFSQ